MLKENVSTESTYDYFKDGNKEKRCKLIDNYFKSIEPTAVIKDEKAFENFLFSKKFPFYDENDNLVEIYIRYCILYLEELNFDLKQLGLDLLDHLLVNISPSKLNLNMRSKLIFDTLERYLNIKESSQFLDTIIQTMLNLLNIIESKYSTSEHQFKKHSQIFDSLLNNCYMSTNSEIKCIYLKNLPNYLKQMDYYSSRHIEKILTITFDFVDHNSNDTNSIHTCLFNIEEKEKLVMISLNLLESLIKQCSLRMHQHARRIINNLIKIVYLYGLSDNSNNDQVPLIIQNIVTLLKLLFEIPKVKDKFHQEFIALKSNNELNQTFLKLIETI
jgi:hypothetical protein